MCKLERGTSIALAIWRMTALKASKPLPFELRNLEGSAISFEQNTFMP